MKSGISISVSQDLVEDGPPCESENKQTPAAQLAITAKLPVNVNNMAMLRVLQEHERVQ